MGDDGSQSSSKIDRILKRTECPFTWKTPMPEVESLQQQQTDGVVDGIKDMVAMVWSQVVVKTKLAAAFCLGKEVGADLVSRKYIVEAYMRIMPPLWEAGDWEDDLVQTYGLALRHLVDATWAHVCREFHGSDPIAMRDLAEFVEENMVHANDLCGHFQAALVAVRAEVDCFPASLSLARKAISMNPDEGQWHCLLAKVMLAARRDAKEQGMMWVYSMQEEMTAAQTAFHLRKNADSYLALARVNEDLGYFSRTVELLREAMTTFPDNAFVAWQAAGVVRALPKPHRDRGLAVRWYEHALKINGDCPLVHNQLATLLMERGDTTAARDHLMYFAEHMRTVALHRLIMESCPSSCLLGKDFDNIDRFQAFLGMMSERFF